MFLTVLRVEGGDGECAGDEVGAGDALEVIGANGGQEIDVVLGEIQVACFVPVRGEVGRPA